MSLLSLPTELIACVADHLVEERYVNALARTSRHLHGVVGSYLYKHNIQHDQGWALFWAASNGQEGTAKRMIEAGVNINRRVGEREETAILWAAQSGQISMVAFFIENGADFQVQDTRGYTAMQWAIELNQVPLARLLMDNGVDPLDTCREQLYDGASALHVACHMNHHEMLVFLLDLGADINARDNNGSTPLLWTVFEVDHIFQFYGARRQRSYRGTVKTAALLLAHNANFEARNRHGDSAYDQAQKHLFDKRMQRLFDDGSVLWKEYSQLFELMD